LRSTKLPFLPNNFLYTTIGKCTSSMILL
jgi:hypothetical protein